MKDDVVARWADLLVEYCLRVERGEAIVISSEVTARPLVEACYKAVLLRGGHPLLHLELAGLSDFYLERATDEQLSFVAAGALAEATSSDAWIRIAAETDTEAMSRVDSRRQALYQLARNPIRQAARKGRWVLTQYPTQAYATMAGMNLCTYEEFVTSAMFLDCADAASAWVDLGARQQGLVEFMSGVNKVRIEATGTDLTLSVGGRTWINSDGRRNMPSGEIFTGPIEDSATGRLHSSFPVCRDGRRLTGIELELDQGTVVKARADEGEDYLLAMLDLDPGARKLGELGLGLNTGIDRFTGSILYDEKIGGTVHLALGQSYPETGGVNASALHWDLIVDTRTQGRITADGRVIMENGQWLAG